MRNIFKKDQILTIPNLLSLVRLALIPVIILLYTVRQDYGLALLAVVISGLTDVADGFIARRFNMISDLGKILDPVVDKLTQAAMIICLASRYKRMKFLFAFMVVKESIMGILWLFATKKTDEVRGAEWFGKLNTMLLYAAMGILILLPNIDIKYANGIINLCAVSMILSLGFYIRHYIAVFKENR